MDPTIARIERDIRTYGEGIWLDNYVESPNQKAEITRLKQLFTITPHPLLARVTLSKLDDQTLLRGLCYRYCARTERKRQYLHLRSTSFFWSRLRDSEFLSSRTSRLSGSSIEVNAQGQRIHFRNKYIAKHRTLAIFLKTSPPEEIASPLFKAEHVAASLLHGFGFVEQSSIDPDERSRLQHYTRCDGENLYYRIPRFATPELPLNFRENVMGYVAPIPISRRRRLRVPGSTSSAGSTKYEESAD